ncbi:M15 family metallopeptidase [Zunongwangia sp.]|uniref:M15 family metallopeptidase n=1 Tax=Zunongwangia sp. TaxID=1965325 RepID=UPI003AA8A591
MYKIYRKFLIIFIFFINLSTLQAQLPDGFVYLKNYIPDIVTELRYASTNNFTGKPVPGYEEEIVITTRQAAEALQKIQNELEEKGFCLKIFDAYRPQQAVTSFIEWSRKPGDTLKKQEFYPQKKKRNLFNLGFIATKSGHSRGSTFDLTLVNANTLEEVDMGGSFDFFGAISHHNYPELTKEQISNRKLLKSVMIKYGFRPYYKEWWHYTLRNEPFPDTYFDFKVQ